MVPAPAQGKDLETLSASTSARPHGPSRDGTHPAPRPPPDLLGTVPVPGTPPYERHHLRLAWRRHQARARWFHQRTRLNREYALVGDRKSTRLNSSHLG